MPVNFAVNASPSDLSRTDSEPSQAGFGEIDIVLDAAEDFVVDDALIAQLQDRATLNSQRITRKLLIFCGEQAARFFVARFADFQLPDAVVVLDSQALEMCFGNISRGSNFFQTCEGGLIGAEAGFAFLAFGSSVILDFQAADKPGEAHSLKH